MEKLMVNSHKKVRRELALEREQNKRSPEAQLAHLEKNYPKGATREKAKLRKLLAAKPAIKKETVDK